MADDTRPARAKDQDDPALNPQFRRNWGNGSISGWDAAEPPSPPQARYSPARRRAEEAWRRVTGDKT